MNQEISANQRTYISKIHRRYQRPGSLPPTSSRISDHPKKSNTEGPRPLDFLLSISTEEAQRQRRREAWIATATVRRCSLERLVRQASPCNFKNIKIAHPIESFEWRQIR
jgi:hypothetical protein